MKSLIQNEHLGTCILAAYLQWPRHGSNTSAHQQTTGLKRCDVYMRVYVYNITQP